MGKLYHSIQVKYIDIAKSGYSGNWIMFRCMQEIIKATIQLERKVMQYDKFGVSKGIKNHPVRVLIENPNKVYSKVEFINIIYVRNDLW